MRRFFDTAIERLKSVFSVSNAKRLRAVVRSFSARERILFWMFLLVLIAGVFWQGARLYFSRTTIDPAFGGVYTEGIVGSVRFLNPVLGDSSDAERVLESLVFAGLFKADYAGGVMPDLAQSVATSTDGKTYIVTLNDNLVWHDGRPFTVEDVLFTIELIKNPELRNPLAINWEKISVDKISPQTVRFVLPASYQPFLHNLTFGILPRHLWSQVPVQNFHLADLNLQPIGAGPYRFKNLQKDKNGSDNHYTLVANRKYSGPGPYLETIVIGFFANYDDAVLALKKKEIDGLGGIPPELAQGPSSSLKFRYFQPVIPRYYAVFFNTDITFFKDTLVREALSRATDKKRVISEVFSGRAKEISSPIVPGMIGAKTTESLFDPEKAKELLLKAGWKPNKDDGVLEKRLSPKDKTLTKFEFELLVPDTPELQKVAALIRGDWDRAGIRMRTKVVTLGEFTAALQARSYHAVLFGQVFATGRNPDPFPFWHSTQKNAPGLNLSLYGSTKADALLEKIRRESNEETRVKMLDEFQTIVTQDYPALFLYTPDYQYAVVPAFRMPDIRFLNYPAERFSRVNEWFLNTRRAWR